MRSTRFIGRGRGWVRPPSPRGGDSWPGAESRATDPRGTSPLGARLGSQPPPLPPSSAPRYRRYDDRDAQQHAIPRDGPARVGPLLSARHDELPRARQDNTSNHQDQDREPSNASTRPQHPHVPRSRASKQKPHGGTSARVPEAPLRTDEPLLGDPDDEAVIERPEDLVAQYKYATEFCGAYKQYNSGGKSHELMEVFLWWFARVLDRLDRKQANGVTLDPHEYILDRLQNVCQAEGLDQFYAMTNYFAEQVIPKGGFTVGQTEKVRNNPDRWIKRDAREQMFAQDESGVLEKSWKADHKRQAEEMWKKRLETRERSIEEAKERREKQLRYDRFRSQRHGRHSRSKQEDKGHLINARFDSRNRIGKGDGSPIAGKSGGWMGRRRGSNLKQS